MRTYSVLQQPYSLIKGIVHRDTAGRVNKLDTPSTRTKTIFNSRICLADSNLPIFTQVWHNLKLSTPTCQFSISPGSSFCSLLDSVSFLNTSMYEDFGFHNLKESLNDCAFRKLCISARIGCLACELCELFACDAEEILYMLFPSMQKPETRPIRES